MRKYILLFNFGSMYANNYAELDAKSKDWAFAIACRLYGSMAVSTVIPANTYGYNLVKLYGKTKI